MPGQFQSRGKEFLVGFPVGRRLATSLATKAAPALLKCGRGFSLQLNGRTTVAGALFFARFLYGQGAAKDQARRSDPFAPAQRGVIGPSLVAENTERIVLINGPSSREHFEDFRNESTKHAIKVGKRTPILAKMCPF